MSASPKTVPASDQLWSCVGSAGVVDIADFGKVQFVGSIVKMVGSDGTTTAHAKVPAAIKATKVQAVVRYEIDPVEGLISSTALGIALKVYCRRGNGDIQAKLIGVQLPSGPSTSVVETALITYVNQQTDKTLFVPDLSVPLSGTLDFVNNSYYIELTLSQDVRPGLPPILPPEVALLHLVTAFE